MFRTNPQTGNSFPQSRPLRPPVWTHETNRRTTERNFITIRSHRGTASNTEGSCESTEQAAADSRQGVVHPTLGLGEVPTPPFRKILRRYKIFHKTSDLDWSFGMTPSREKGHKRGTEYIQCLSRRVSGTKQAQKEQTIMRSSRKKRKGCAPMS